MNDFPRTPETPDELDARIRSMIGAARDAAPPAPQLDLDDSVVPLSRRQSPNRMNRGWLMAGLAAVGTAAAVTAAVVVMNDDASERLQPAPPATEPTGVTTVPATTPDSTPDPTNGPTTTLPIDVQPTWLGYVAGPDGVIGLAGSDRYDATTDRYVTITDEPFAAAFAGPAGMLYVQRHVGPAAPGTDAWSPEQTAVELFDPSTSESTPVDLPHDDGTWLRLHDVGTLAGEQVILYEEVRTPNPTSQDAGRLLLQNLVTGEQTVVDDDFGGWERSSTLFQVADNGLVVGETYESVTSTPTIIRVLDSAPDVLPATLGLQPFYTECVTECPRMLTVDPTGTVFAYLWRGTVNWTDLEASHVSELGDGGVDLTTASQLMVTADAAAVATADTTVVLTTGGDGTTVPGTFVSLASDTPAPTVTNELDPSDVDGTLVVDQRVVTDDDRARLPDDRNGTGLILSCAAPTLKTGGEYDVGLVPSESGIPARERLASAVAGVNAEVSLPGAADVLPASGWTMIVDGSNRWFVLPDAGDGWRAVVSVAGKPWADAWRHYDTWFCPTDESTPVTQAPQTDLTEIPVSDPALAAPEDGMAAVTNALGDALSYPDATSAADALVTALSRPDGCDVDPTARLEDLGDDGAAHLYLIEYRFGCDDAGGGFDIEFTVTRDDASSTWIITTATLQTYCLRGVTNNGLCV